MNRPKSVSRDAGFTMIEMLVILLVALVLAMMSYPELMKYYIRSQFEGFTQQVSYVMQRAKYRAIKRSQEVRVCADTDNRAVTGLGQTIELPDSVSFDASPDSEDPGPVTVPGNCFTFRSDGSVQEPGAFRFADVRGNFLEVRIEFKAAARVQVRKWDETEEKWYARGQGGKAWEWKTGVLH